MKQRKHFPLPPTTARNQPPTFPEKHLPKAVISVIHQRKAPKGKNIVSFATVMSELLMMCLLAPAPLAHQPPRFLQASSSCPTLTTFLDFLDCIPLDWSLAGISDDQSASISNPGVSFYFNSGRYEACVGRVAHNSRRKRGYASPTPCSSLFFPVPTTINTSHHQATPNDTLIG